jgi:acetylornithine/succinyldiaminopimelate/putrescine aminotransferase
LSDDLENLRDRVRTLTTPVKVEKKKREKKVSAKLARQRMLFALFPFHPDLEEFETVDFNDIDTAKMFVEETEAEAATIVNGDGSYVASFVMGTWYSYV